MSEVALDSACISATVTLLSVACLAWIKLFNLPTSALPVHEMNTEQNIPQRGIMNHQQDVWRESPDSAHKCQPELSASSHLSEASGGEGIGRASRSKAASKMLFCTKPLYTSPNSGFEHSPPGPLLTSFHLVPISEKRHLENEAHSAGSNSFHFCSLPPPLKVLPAQLFPVVWLRALFLPLQVS